MIAVVVIVVLVIVFTPQQITEPVNLFPNPGFENDRDPWFSLKPPDFILSDTAHTGEKSAVLQMNDSANETGSKVYYLVQEISPDKFPEKISGWYRVENWKKGTDKQYVQFVVIVWQATNLKGGYNNHQIRYPLAGIADEPFVIKNAYFIFIGKDAPVENEWVYFERNVAEDFKEKWGAVPEGFKMLRILFEVRYDDKNAGETVKGDVFYDDLFLG